MSRNTDREEALRIAAEKMRLKREKEQREENEFYQRITTGRPWLIFKVVVVFCTLMALLTTIEYFVDGPAKKLREADCSIDRSWEWDWHRILDVEGYTFAPELGDWLDRKKNSMEITYSPIFRTGKKLSFDVVVDEHFVKRQEVARFRSVFEWFPVFQVFLLIPLITFLFKQQKPWFNFARLLSLFFVLPGSLLAIYYGIY